MAVCFTDIVSVTTSTTQFGVGLDAGVLIYNIATKEAIILGEPVVATSTWNDITNKNYITTKTVKINLDAAAVAALGTPQELLPASGADKAYDITDIKFKCTPTSQLDVSSQNLILYLEGLTLYLAMIRNDKLENAAGHFGGVQVQAEHEGAVNKKLYCKLDNDTNPLLGVATMTFWITYTIIDVT